MTLGEPISRFLKGMISDEQILPLHNLGLIALFGRHEGPILHRFYLISFCPSLAVLLMGNTDIPISIPITLMSIIFCKKYLNPSGFRRIVPRFNFSQSHSLKRTASSRLQLTHTCIYTHMLATQAS